MRAARPDKLLQSITGTTELIRAQLDTLTDEQFALRQELNTLLTGLDHLLHEDTLQPNSQTDLQRMEAQPNDSAEREVFRVILSDTLRALSNPVDIQAKATRLLGEQLDVNRAVYFEVAGSDYVVAQDYVKTGPAITGRHPMNSFGEAMLRGYRGGYTVIANDTAHDPDLSEPERAAFAGIQIGAFVGVPLVKNGVFVAGLTVHSIEPRQWTQEEIAFVEETAERTREAVERGRAETALMENEQRLQLSLKVSGMGTFVWYPQEDRTEPDDRMMELVGLPLDGTLSLQAALAQMLHPDDTARYAKAVTEAIDPAGNGVLQQDIRFIMPNGSYRWLAILGQVFFEGVPARPARMVGGATDITARKWAEEQTRESEEKYRSLFNSIDEGFTVIQVIFDEEENPVDYRFLEINAAFERQTGLGNAVGKRVRDLVPQHEQYWFDIYGKVALTGEAIRFENRAEMLHRNYDVYAFRVGDPDERIVGVVFNDITTRKEIENRLHVVAEQNAFRVMLSDALRPLAEPVEIQAEASRVLGEYLNVNRVAYAEIVGEDGIIYQDYAKDVPTIRGRFRIENFGANLTAALARGETLAIEDVTLHDELTESDQMTYAALNIRAYVGVSLIKAGKWVATLGVYTAEPRAWTTDEVALVQETAERTWAALEQARAEEALQVSEEKYRTLFNSVDEGYILVDVIFDENDQPVDILYLDANPAAVRMTGTELAGKRTRELNPNYEQHWYDIFGRVAKSGVSERHELPATPLDLWYSFYAFKSGPPASRRVAVIYQDITERKRRETFEDQIQALDREQRVVAEALRDTAEGLSSSLKLDEVLETALVSVRKLAAYETAFLVLVEGSKVTQFRSAGLNPAEHDALQEWHQKQDKLKEALIYRAATNTWKPTLIKSRSKTKGMPAPISSAQSLITLPFFRGSTFMGFLVLANQLPNTFDALEIPKLQAFAFQLASALVNVQQFSQAQELAVLQERQRLARELHDEVSQTLFSASIISEGLVKQWERKREIVPELLMDVNRQVRGAMAEMRKLLLELRPTNVQTTPFIQLIQYLVTAIQARENVNISVNFDGEPILNSEIRMGMYRIAQEALNNVIKHARATEAQIEGRGGDGAIELHIRDNGVGFESDKPSTGLGLDIMRERSEEIDARLEIHSQPGGGTDVYVIWPNDAPFQFYKQES